MTRTVGGFLILAALVTCGFGGYRYYQKHHLSSDLKRTLTAAMDPNATMGDIAGYFRDSRLQVRTEMDEELLQKCERQIQLVKDSGETIGRVYQENLRSAASVLLETDGDQTRRKQEQDFRDSEAKRAQDEATTARRLQNEIRADLGLAAAP